MNKRYGITFKLIRIAVDEKVEDKLNLDDLDFIDQGLFVKKYQMNTF